MTDARGSDADALARRCADAMWADDQASRSLGIRLLEVRQGRASVSMTVTGSMVNGHGLMHGGYIFLLADSAFAYACNTYDRRTVAQHCSITFLRSGKLGDTLTATAEERILAGRSGIYDVTVRRADGEMVAEFRGHSRVIEGSLLAAGGS
jgi:acyl-CoA thioesterase